MQGFLIIAPIIILMAIGAIMRKVGFLVESDVKCLSKLVFWIISPAILFRGALNLEMNWASHANYAISIYASAALIAVLVYLFGRYVLRNAGGAILPISVLASFRCNSIMIGIPVVMLAFGERGAAPIAVYFAVTETGYNLMSIVSAELVRGGSGSFREMVRKALRGIAINPMLWASLSGLALSAMGFHSMPEAIDTVFVAIANMATGASVLMIGASLDVSAIRRSVSQLVPDTAVRLLVHPALLLLCFKFFPAAPEMMQTAVVITAAPAPNIAFVLAQGMGFDADYAAGLIGITTVAFVVTMPIWLNVLNLV